MVFAICSGRSSTKHCCKFGEGELSEEPETGKVRAPGEDGEKNPTKGSRGTGLWVPRASGRGGPPG